MNNSFGLDNSNSSMNNGIGSIGNEFNQQTMQPDMSFEEEKKKFPLSTREIVLVAIALLAIIGVVIYYALM